MDDERIAFREKAQLFAELAADMDPVFGRDFHEIDVPGRRGHEFVHHAAPEAEADAAASRSAGPPADATAELRGDPPGDSYYGDDPWFDRYPGW